MRPWPLRLLLLHSDATGRTGDHRNFSLFSDFSHFSNFGLFIVDQTCFHPVRWVGRIDAGLRSNIAFNGFEEENGIKIVDGSFGQTSEIMSKIKAANGGEWDLVEVDNDTIYFGTLENLWQPLRLENIPNHDKLPDIFKTNGHGAFDPGYKDGVFHGIPGPMYGTTPVVINTTK